MSLEVLAGCLIIRNGKVLLVKEKEDPYWKIPSGKVEEGESLEECAMRETKKETGLKVKPLSLFGTYRSRFKGRNSELHVYNARIVEGYLGYLNPTSDDNVGYVRLCPIDFLNADNATPPDRLIYQDLMRK